MLTTHIYLDGRCREAIQLYEKAFGAHVDKIIEDPEDGTIVHAEIRIHRQPLMLNDTGSILDPSPAGGYQLSVQFDSQDELMKAYSLLKNDARIIFPLQATDYSDCVVRLIDQFSVRWALWL
jgi:PhnB protein